MNEIKKMYKNAGVESVGFNPYKLEDEYPPFTAEKQLELIKRVSPSYPLNYHIKCFQGYTFEEGLALCVNNLWQFLTEEEKEVVHGILRT